MEPTAPAATAPASSEEAEDSTRARHLTPYVRLVKEAIQHTHSRPDLLRLFDAQELEPVQRFLDGLSERAQCLLVRLILRKGPWFRIDSMINYREVHGDMQPAQADEQDPRSENETQTRKLLNLAELVAELQQQRLLMEVSLDDPLEALQAVQQVLAGPELRALVDKLGLKVKSAAKLATKQAAVQVLQDRLQKQASMFASKLPVGREASRLLRSLPQISGFPANLPVIVRVDPDIVTGIRRIIRLTQLTCWNSAATSGRTAISINEPQTWNTSLLVILGKIRFPKYSCQISAPPFADQQQFRRWEVANELRWWMEKCMLLPETMGHPFSYSSHMFATHLTRCGLEVAAKSIGADMNRKAVLDAFTDMLAAVTDLCVCFLATFPRDAKQMQQEASNALEMCTMYARKEVDVFVFWALLAALLLQLHHASEDGASPSSLPEYLKHLDAGSVLCTIVWDTIPAFEQTRDYIAAILLLRTLLATPYMSHRRGRWYQRLAIDLEHLGFYAAALDAAQAAVLDSSVKGGDRLTMQKKLVKLKKKIVVDGNASRAAEQLAQTVFGHILDGRACACEQQHPVCITTVSQLLQFVVSDDAHLSLFQDQRPRNVTSAIRVHAVTTRQSHEEEEVVVLLGGGDAENANDGNDDDDDDDDDLLFVSPKAVRSHTVSVVRSSKMCKTDMKSEGVRRLNSLDSFFTKSEVRGVAISSPLASTITAVSSSSLSASSKRKSEGSYNDDAGPADSELSVQDVQMLGLIEPPWKWRGLQVRSITGRRLNNVTGFKSRFVGYNDGDVCDVENLVLQDLFETEGWFGWHCEGGPVRTIFSLLMWDILFAPYPDVFQTPFQDAPLDLDYPPLFYTQRAHFIEERLQEIAVADHGALCEWLSESYRSHYREMCRGVSWRYELRALQLAAVCVGGLGLSAICRALSVNYKQLASGQPDLMMVRVRPAVKNDPACINSSLTMLETSQGTVLDLGAWLGDALFDKPETDKLLPDDADLTSLVSPFAVKATSLAAAPSATPRSATQFTYEGDDLQLSALSDGWVFECMFVEVKGPSDTLADKQRLWLQILSSCGLTAYVCKVREGLENQPKGSHADHASNKKRRLSRPMSK